MFRNQRRRICVTGGNRVEREARKSLARRSTEGVFILSTSANRRKLANSLTVFVEKSALPDIFGQLPDTKSTQKRKATPCTKNYTRSGNEPGTFMSGL